MSPNRRATMRRDFLRVFFVCPSGSFRSIRQTAGQSWGISTPRARVAEVDAAGFCLGHPARGFDRYLGFQFREPLVDLAQKREMRIPPVGSYEKAGNADEGLPGDTGAEVLQPGQIVGPQIV